MGWSDKARQAAADARKQSMKDFVESREGIDPRAKKALANKVLKTQSQRTKALVTQNPNETLAKQKVDAARGEWEKKTKTFWTGGKK